MSLLEMSFYGAVMIVAIILIRAVAIHKLPKRIFLILWSIALLRLLVPFDFSSSFSVYGLLQKESTIQNEAIEISPVSPDTTENSIILPQNPETATASRVQANGTAENPELSTNTASPLDPVIPIFPLLWAVGAIGCALFFLVSYLKCTREFRTSLPVTEGYALEWLRKHTLVRKIEIRQSDRILAPLTYGIFHPVILLPKKTDWENTQQLEYVLYHEYTHIRRLDLVSKLLTTVALCLHWFNPFVWAMYYFFNRDIELSCDECVMIHSKNEEKASYARALISMEEKKSRLTPLCNNFSKTAIEERITAIMKSKKATTGMIIVGIIIILVVVITLATTAKTEVPENSSSDFTMTPFKDTDFTSGEFDEEAFAQDIWTRYLEYCEVYNTCINKSMTPAEYTEEDYLVMEHNGVMNNFIGMLPVTDSRFSSMQDFETYIASVSTESYANYLYSLQFMLTPETSDFAKLIEYNGTLYSRIYDFEEPLTYEQGDAFLFLCENNEVYLVVRNEPTSSFVSLSFAQENGVWYASSHPHFDTYIPDSINRTVYKYSFSPAKVMQEESAPVITPLPEKSDEITSSSLSKEDAIKLFTAYRDMEALLFETNLACENISGAADWVTINGHNGYTKVINEQFPTLQSVIDYMETICTPEYAEKLRNKYLHMEEDFPALAELDGQLYTTPYDAPVTPLSYRFTELVLNPSKTFTIRYEGFHDAMINVWETGTMTLFKTENGWRVSSLDYVYENPYFSDYNGEKLQRIATLNGDCYSPRYCNDIIFYRADDGETLDDILFAMKTAILQPLTSESPERAYTVTDYDISTQRYEYIDESAWRLPMLDGWYSYEGIDLAPMESRLQEGITDAAGRVPFLAQGSDEVFYFILLQDGDVYRLQREDAAAAYIQGTWDNIFPNNN